MTLSPMRATATSQTVDSANNDDREMFSPTSAAALALSTLHQHGADRNKRPEDLKGTRLFIQGDNKEEREQEEKEPPSRMVTQAPMAAPTFYASGTPSNAAPPVPAHYPPPPPGYQYAPDPRYSHPTGSSPWQPTQYHQYPNVSVMIHPSRHPKTGKAHSAIFRSRSVSHHLPKDPYHDSCDGRPIASCFPDGSRFRCLSSSSKRRSYFTHLFSTFACPPHHNPSFFLYANLSSFSCKVLEPRLLWDTRVHRILPTVLCLWTRTTSPMLERSHNHPSSRLRPRKLRPKTKVVPKRQVILEKRSRWESWRKTF